MVFAYIIFRSKLIRKIAVTNWAEVKWSFYHILHENVRLYMINHRIRWILIYIVHCGLHISVWKLIHMNFCDRMSYLFSMVTKSLLYLSFFMWHMSLYMTPESNKWDYKKGCLGVTWWWLIQPCFGYCIPIASNGCFLPYKYIFS